ncbi:MAG: asparagine synthase-related protein [Synechocystis sp.]|nr:asparagine synthase-related protein [Synechocystis sp.]
MYLSALMSAFVSIVSFKCEQNDNYQAHHLFSDIVKQKPTYCFETNTKLIQISCSQATKIGKSKDANLFVMLHGEIYQSCLDQASYLADQFAKYGDRVVKEIHGSFAILLIDKLKDTVSLITDRINSRRVFYSNHHNYYCLSSHFGYQPWEMFPLDATGIAWYLSNYSVRCNRTLFEGISIFDRATIHQLSRENIHSQTYWDFKVNLGSNQKNKKQLQAELSELLIQSVKRRLYDSPHPVLSLSAGYDSTAILGILACDLKIPQLSCFSFDHGASKPGSDSFQAALMAQKVGCPFETIETYQGDFVGFIINNAHQAISNGLSWLSSEVDAWPTLKNKFSQIDNAAFFCGDECFGTGNYMLINWLDVLASLRVYQFKQLDFLRFFLPAPIYQVFEQGISEDIETIIQRCLPHANFYDARFILDIDEATGGWLLPYRESFAGQFFNVRNPLLDNDILDFMATTPTSCRWNKSLFRSGVSKFYPELFSIPRATSPGNIYFDLTQAFITHEMPIRSLINHQKSRLDLLFSPEVLLNLLDYVISQPNLNISSKPNLAQKNQYLFGRIKQKIFPGKPKIRPTNAAHTLTKLLILRVALFRGV